MNSRGHFKEFRYHLMRGLCEVEVSGEPFEFNRSTAIYLIGNGGSCAVAQHIAVDLVKNGWHAFALTDPAVMSMWANDEGWVDVFRKQLESHGGGNDVLIAISSSGRSGNILDAVNTARERHMRVITLSGFEAFNPLRKLGDVNYYVPSSNYGVVEITHLAILHSIANPGIK